MKQSKPFQPMRVKYKQNMVPMFKMWVYIVISYYIPFSKRYLFVLKFCGRFMSVLFNVNELENT